MGNYMSSWGSTGAGVVGKVKGADYRGAADKAKDMAGGGWDYVNGADYRGAADKAKDMAGGGWDSAKRAVKRRTSNFQDYEDEDYEEDFQDYEYEYEDEEEEFANYPNEPKWMQSIQNSTICNWFYVFYIISLVLFVISLAVTVSGFFARGSKMTPVQAFFSISISAIAAVNTLFYYLVCDRSLQP